MCGLVCVFCLLSANASALSTDRWTNGDPYGVFFNKYDPNFYTGFAPRVQEGKRVTIHLGRGNQLRVRLVLSGEAIDNYLLDQVARYQLYKDIIFFFQTPLPSQIPLVQGTVANQ